MTVPTASLKHGSELPKSTVCPSAKMLIRRMAIPRSMVKPTSAYLSRFCRSIRFLLYSILFLIIRYTHAVIIFHRLLFIWQA